MKDVGGPWCKYENVEGLFCNLKKLKSSNVGMVASPKGVYHSSIPVSKSLSFSSFSSFCPFSFSKIPNVRTLDLIQSRVPTWHQSLLPSRRLA